MAGPLGRFQCVVVLAATLLGTTACAQTAAVSQPTKALTLDQVLDNMEAARRELKTFSADVVKVRYIEVLEETEHFQGTIHFKMPRLLRLYLKQTENGNETIYIVGEKYGWIYRPQKKQVERATLRDMKGKADSANPLEYGLARDIHGLRKAYLLQLRQPEKVGDVDTVPIELTPREGDGYGDGRMVFWIDTKTWLPAQVREFKSNNEIVETHTLSNIKVNVKIKSKLFKFKVPKGVDQIIHEE